MYPECEFAAMKLQVKTREYDRIEESQMSKMTMREILVPLIRMRKLHRKLVSNEFHLEHVESGGLGNTSWLEILYIQHVLIKTLMCLFKLLMRLRDEQVSFLLP